jgi:hypothetical protein
MRRIESLPVLNLATGELRRLVLTNHDIVLNVSLENRDFETPRVNLGSHGDLL